jgi:hypothetical protein
MTLIGGIVGAVVTGYYNNKTSIELEQVKFETGLIIKALEIRDQPSQVKTLKFLAHAGLIGHYEKAILKLADREHDLELPAAAQRDAIASPISSFVYQTSPSEVDPGRREWQRIRPGHWTETYPHGQISYFSEKTRITLNGCSGTVVINDSEPNFQIFISDKGCTPMALWFRRENQNWIYLRPMTEIK